MDKIKCLLCGESFRSISNTHLFYKHNTTQSAYIEQFGDSTPLHSPDLIEDFKTINISEENGQWKGDIAGLSAIHMWVKKRLPKPHSCERCGKKTKDLDLANISQKYLRSFDDWEYLCRKCHMDSDGRKENLLKGISKRKAKPCKRCGVALTRSRYCKSCSREVRLEWWVAYNKKRNQK